MVKVVELDAQREASLQVLFQNIKNHLSKDWDRVEPWVRDLVQRYEGPYLYPPGSVFWDMKETRTDHYFVLEGLVAEEWKSSREESFIYAFVGDGEYCVNEFQYLYGEPSRSRFQVIQPTRVLVLRQEEESLIRSTPSPWDQLSFEVGRGILNKRRERLRFLSGDKGVHLQHLFHKYPGARTWATKDQLASYLGVSRATVYRLLDKSGLMVSNDTVENG